MKDYLVIANSKVFFICGAVIISFIILQSLMYMRLAYKEGLKIGLSKDKMVKAFRTGVISTIVPTIAVIVALMTMTPVLGIPIPWIRLSIIGSAPYELMAAGIGAKSMGVDTLGGTGYTKEVFASSIWIMCVGSIWAIMIVTFFLKKIKARYARAVNTDPKWRSILMNAAFIGVFSIFIADPLTTGGLPLATLLSGAAIMTLFAMLIVKFKQNWLREFALAFSMIGAMVCTVLIAKLF
ncbi:DUF5058 family protein [Alkaliphilus peptidifermentans]|uniref:DUF5058 domain-containing protein n=1 Tax=Alkaliphilus peptidifermentans DSM 18978 TaxID=1120976 RepID=A0A1G5J090_9FIRM|nr:DUF5058 family protein [Alkaliphilus peptidifermentans]SCY81756.1 protein of unknown function [Alkaliphilus peptidifermentans DSM 18978]